MQVDLSRYDNSCYTPGRSPWIQALWFFVGLPVLRASWIPFSGLRVWLLRLFGARVGKGAVIKPGVRVKYPWRLEIGNHCWIGEDSWIDNLAAVAIGSNVCISQGAYLCTGNHDWTDSGFALITRPIFIQDGAWVGAKALICPGTSIGAGAVASAGCVASGRLEPYTIYSGNPATPIKHRIIRESEEMVPAAYGTPAKL